MTIEKFKVKAIRTITSPSNSDITTYYTWVNFQDLPSNISLDVNPRKPKMNTAVAKQLIAAVTSSDVLGFDINNRGIVITAKNVKFDNTASIISLDLGDDSSVYGILDGGHTYTAIIQNRDKLTDQYHNEAIDKYVKLEIVVGDEVDVSGLADARNTSAQVSDIALFELDDKFDFIKKSIEGTSFEQDVAYKDNDNKSIRIGELLKLLFAFNIKRFPDDSTAPVSAYSGKAAVFRDYKKEIDATNQNSTEKNIYEQLAPQLPKLVELYEKIEFDIPKKYQEFKNEDGKNASFGNVRGIEGAGKFESEFTKSSIKYQVSVGFLLPIFGAFRALLKEREGEIIWEFDPIEVWDKAGLRLVQNTFDTDTNPQNVGKSKTLWQANYRIVDSVRKDMLLDRFLNNN